jgi:hypothetical protein
MYNQGDKKIRQSPMFLMYAFNYVPILIKLFFQIPLLRVGNGVASIRTRVFLFPASPFTSELNSVGSQIWDQSKQINSKQNININTI